MKTEYSDDTKFKRNFLFLSISVGIIVWALTWASATILAPTYSNLIWPVGLGSAWIASILIPLEWNTYWQKTLEEEEENNG